MKNRNVYILIMALLPWITMFFIDKKSVKRFYPSALFMSFYLLIEAILADKRKWWWFSINLKPNWLGEFPIIIGPFFVGSLWILKYTYGKFNLYFLINLVVDSFFTYILVNWLKKIGYVSLVRMSKFQLSLCFLLKVLSMYGFQFLFEKCFKRNVIRSE